MKKLLVLASLLFAINSFAVPPKPPKDCGKDEDHDGWCVKDMSRNDPATGKPGFLIGTEDCADADAAVNPGAKEIPDDGIDNDCDSGDLKAPAYAKNFRCKSAGCLKTLDAEIAACNKATTAQCEVNYTNGTFATKYGFYFIDTDCNGVREVIDQAGKDAYDLKVKTGWKCGGTRSSGSGHSGTRRSGSGSTKVIVKLDTKAVDAEAKARKDSDDAIVKRLLAEEEFADEIDGRTGVLEKDLKAETEARKAADAVLGEGVEKAQKTADKAHKLARGAANLARQADDNANEAKSLGVDFGLDVAVGVKAQNPLTLKGDGTARGAIAPSVLVLAHVGAETKGGIYRVIGGVGKPWENSGEAGKIEMKPGFMWTVGLEALSKVNSTNAVGASLSYLDHESAGTVAATHTKSRGAFLAAVWQLSPEVVAGSFRFNAVKISLGVGVESFGTKTDPVWDDAAKQFVHNESVNTGLAGMFTLSTGFGMGSSER